MTLGWKAVRARRRLKGSLPVIASVVELQKHVTVAPNGCWEWNGCDGTHYPLVHVQGQKVMPGNRAVWFLTHGELPARLHVLHSCDNKACVNPAHLVIGTPLANHRDYWAKVRMGLRRAPRRGLCRDVVLARWVKIHGIDRTSITRFRSLWNGHRNRSLVHTALSVPMIVGDAQAEVKWDTLDWTLRDVELAAQTGMSRERVRQKRRDLGKPNPPHYRKSKDFIEFERFVMADPRALDGLSLDEIFRKFGRVWSPRRASQILGSLNVQVRYGGQMRPWDLIDWGLSNRELATIWRMGQQIVRQRRYDSNRGQPQWDGRNHQNDPHRQARYDQESARARDWFERTQESK